MRLTFIHEKQPNQLCGLKGIVFMGIPKRLKAPYFKHVEARNHILKHFCTARSLPSKTSS
ncbi:hypothetical protein E2C01_075621 [Portunus trituberculatus]|uniref:Uncharacterized protein n=1 Tax=Portunus trituberculatus TaxID=210409 RepID=A0A5B7I6J9_PORTR|nr:hypothetical protein [Portunus trituberculatus]